MKYSDFRPTQYRLLDRLGLPAEVATDASAATKLYQDLMRSNLRVPDAIRTVECIVRRSAAANALAEEFEGCTVERLPADLIPELAGRQQGPAPTGAVMPDAERHRRRRALLREEKEQALQQAKKAA